MSGAGKSTLGAKLAKALNKPFVDTDPLIEQRAGKSLQAILDEDGIDVFLALEEDVLANLSLQNCVIATGGSAVYSEKAMTALKCGGIVVYLHVPYEELVKRLKNVSVRGIVMRAGNSLKDVYDERLPLYRAYADVTVDCSGRTTDECLSALLDALHGKM